MKFIENKLTDLYEQWLNEQGLPQMSAEEVLAGGWDDKPLELTDDQEKWLQAFIALWEANEVYDVPRMYADTKDKA